MAMQVKPETGEVGLKQRYRVTNWSEYDRARVNRGNLTLWFDEASIRDSWTPPRPIGRGKPGLYSATAIQTCLTIKTLFRLPYRVTEGLIKSLMRLCHLDLPVPDYTHMSRRAGELSVKIPRQGPTHGVVDATGLKIFGKGEWAEAGLREASLRAAGAGRLCKADRGTVRQHEVGKRRTWRKSGSMSFRLETRRARLGSARTEGRGIASVEGAVKGGRSPAKRTLCSV